MEALKSDQAEKTKHDDLRAEYGAVVGYHTALVTSRFTIAGMLIAGSAFLAPSVVRSDISPGVRCFGSAFATWLTLCVWVLELRSRARYINLAHRGIQIEHEHWRLTGREWYDGFFSRQYKIPPPADTAASDVPTAPGNDIVTVFGQRLPDEFARWVRHSIGFDLLYAGAASFWLLAAIICAGAAVFR